MWLDKLQKLFVGNPGNEEFLASGGAPAEKLEGTAADTEFLAERGNDRLVCLALFRNLGDSNFQSSILFATQAWMPGPCLRPYGKHRPICMRLNVNHLPYPGYRFPRTVLSQLARA